MKVMSLAVLLITGCANVHVNRAALAASTAALACDWMQSRYAEGHREMWHTRWETNPVLGPRPSAREIDTYFTTAALINAAVWLVMPQRYRTAIPVIIIGVQADTISNNVRTTGTICGL